jgi:hypothetical protein
MRLLRTRRHAPTYRALLAALISMVLSCGTALAGPPPGPPYGGQADTLTVLGRSLAAQHSDRINIKDAPFGAYGDTQSSNLLQVTIAAGSAALHVAAGAFTPTDVGKRVNVDGAGPLRSLGYLQSIPVTTPGVYTTRPVITLSGTGNSAGVVPLPLMAVQSAVVATGGAGFPASASVTLTMSIGSGGTAAQITGTTNPSGVLVGPLTVSIAGSYQQGTATDALLATATQTPVSANNTPTTFPTISLVWGLGGVQVAGQGAGLPLTGVSAAITGSATLGAPVVGQVVTPLSGKILSVSSPTDLVLDTTATTAVTNSQLGLTWGHDDAPAIAAAKAAADARFALGGAYPVLYAPAGNYLISSPTPAFSHQAGAIVGDGPGRTTFKLDANLAGPLFSWSEDWIGGNVSPGPFPVSGPTADLARFYYGPFARGFAVVGDLTALGEQDALVLYDRNDRVHFEDVTGWYLNGRMAYAGVSLNVPTQAFMREAHWLDVYCGHCGAPGVPVYELSTVNTAGIGDSTNTNDFVNLVAWDVAGPGLVIRNNAPATAKPTSILTFTGGRIEGGAVGVSTDLVTLGDPTMTGAVSNVSFLGTRVIAGYAGSSALKLTAPSAASQPYGITAAALLVSPTNGRGINIQAGKQIRLDILALSTVDTGFTIGSSSTVSQPIVLDGRGQERNWTWNVDPTSYNAIMEPLFRTGDPTGGNGAVVANMHDGSASGGLPPASGCVDFQTIRTASSQTCQAQYGAILGGRLNTIALSGVGATILGGSGNNANGSFSQLGGLNAGDSGLYGVRAYSGGNFTIAGDAEIADQPLRGTALSTTPIRLTSDNTTAGAHDTLNLPAGGGLYAFGRVTVAGYDPANVNGCVWYVDGLAAKKGALAATTALVGAPTIMVANCDSALGLTASALAIVADTTNGGVSITATGKAGVNLHVVVDGHFVAVQ